MQNTLIVTGGSINISFLKEHLKENEYNYIIASDKGLEVLDSLNIKPNYIIGDFDSIDTNVLDKYINSKNIELVKLNPMKDFTDTHMALKHAIEIKSTRITIIGAIGSRIDHTISNIHILKETLENNIPCEIINENNKVFLVNKDIEIKKENEYPYISLIPLTTKAEGVSLIGFKYGLENAVIKIGESIGISNEQIENTCSLKIKEGILIVIKAKD